LVVALIGLVSAKGSPGVTTTALALTLRWPRRVVLAECDPAGGDVLAGYFAGSAEASGGLLALASAARRGQAAAELPRQLIALDQDRARCVLPGLADPAQAAGIAQQWTALADLFTSLDIAGEPVDVLADCGRLGAAHPPVELLRHADAVALVLGSSLVAVRSAYPWMEALGRDLPSGVGASRLTLVLGGENQPYSPHEIARQLGAPVAGALPWDARAAAVLSAGAPAGRGFWQSPLMRAAPVVSEGLLDLAVRHTATVAQPGTSSDNPSVRVAR
jgi:hypothetical protein